MSENQKAKIHRCRYSRPELERGKIKHLCVVNWKKESCDEAKCESCEKFDSKYIEYPIIVNEIQQIPIDTTNIEHEIGRLCEVKPCGKEYNGKTYLGIYIGDLPIKILSSFEPKKGTLVNSTLTNPAIFVPELKKIIYGCESFWREIKSIEDFKGISSEDIEDVWYIKLLKSMSYKDEQ